MNRRSFFGFATGGIAAAPTLVGEASGALSMERATNLATLGLSVDSSSVRAAMADLDAFSGVLKVGRAMSVDRPGDRYVHRTGNAAIDALRSVSGVYREQMVRRLEG